MKQEIWITLRLKGYVDADADVQKVGENLLSHLENHIREGGQAHGFMSSQPGDVLEIEEEAEIYDTE
ncbi:hypothetical protein ABE527_02485 [Brucella sp. TWI432]